MSTAELRAQWVAEAEHSLFLEGLSMSSEHKATAERYIAGEISADELVRMTRLRYGLK